MSASAAEVGDIVMCHGMNTGKVVHKFLSKTGEEVYDIELFYRPFRVAALEHHIVINLRPEGQRQGITVGAKNRTPGYKDKPEIEQTR